MTEPEFTTQELETEEWRDVVGYEGIYSVSNLGRVRRDKPAMGATVGRILKTRPDHAGYLGVTLANEGQNKSCCVHILVARAFLGECPEGREVNHKDASNPDRFLVKRNNRATNLEYLTSAENIDHAYRHGLMTVGEQHWKAKLTEADVRVIRASTKSIRALAREFDINKCAIQGIKRGKNWKHVID